MRYDFVIPQGSVVSKLVSILHEENGQVVPFNLSGFSARMQVKERTSDSTSILSLPGGDGSLTIDNDEGTILIYIPPTTTERLDFTVANYDLEIYNELGEVYRVLEGSIVLSREVTK